MNINNLGLLNKLGSYINDADKGGNDYAISQYLLQHLHHIANMTVNDIVDNAFVSHSAVRRFCMELGYENFSHLKQSLDDIIYPSNIHLRNFEPIHGYRKSLSGHIALALSEIDAMVDDHYIRSICQLLYNHDDIYMIGANNTAGNLTKFQQEMFYANKIIHLLHSDFENPSNNVYSAENNLIIVISVSGVFATAISHIMAKREGNHRLLITANREENLGIDYEQVCYISPSNISDDKLGVLGKYGVTYLLDLISEEYIFKYGNSQ